MEERVYRLALSNTTGVGDILFKQLVSYCGSAKNVFEATKSKLLKIPGVGAATVDALRASASLLAVYEEELMSAEKLGVRILTYTDNDYPSRLKEINDAPAILYYKGSADLNDSRCLAIVGTRNCTEYGKQTVEEIITGVTAHNPLIISGLAYGIDIHAHKIALEQGLETVAVMASGVDVIYPNVHKKISQKMVKQGGLLSEYRLGIKPDAPNFPSRNRIIAGLVDGVVVVEAAERGGALITAELANGYNREVLAVPGKTTDSFSAGCNRLIRNHKAHIYTGPADIPYLLGWPDSDDAPEAVPDYEGLSDEERTVLELLQKNPDGLLLDQLSWKSQIVVHELVATLLHLELGGHITSLPGKRYRIK